MAMKQGSTCSSLDFRMNVLMNRSVDVLWFSLIAEAALLYISSQEFERLLPCEYSKTAVLEIH